MSAPELSSCPLAVSARHEQLGEIAAKARRIEYERDGVQLIHRRPQQLDGAREVAITEPCDQRIAGGRPRHPERVIHLRRIPSQPFTVSLDANAKGAAGFEMGPGLSIELPLLSQNQGRRARAAAELEQAARRYIAVRTSVAAEIATAFAGLAEARATAQLLGGDVGASMAAARQQAERLYAAGEISLVDLLQVRQRLIDIESTRVDTAFGVNRAVVRLEQAAGRRCETR